ncbi:MAG: DUF503 domain-containing protein [Anaerolineae bacterium]
MVIGLCTLQLQIPAAQSLKDKRQVIKSVTARVRNQFNVSIAEIAQQDAHQLATLAVVCVSGEGAQVQSLLERTVQFIRTAHSELVLLDYETELL